MRLSRFPALVWADRDSVYDITMTGSPAKRLKFTLNSQERRAAMIVRIAYPGAESRQIKLNGRRVDMNQWNERERGYAAIKRSKCGENRFIGVKNILEFYLT